MKYKSYILIVFLIFCILFPVSNIYASKLLTDQMGRKVTIPDNPIRVVSLAPSITEIVFVLGHKNRLVGVTRFSDFPETAKKLPKVGSYVHLDLEKIISLKPDLCIAIKDGNPKVVVDRLESLNIPVYVVNPRNLETVMKTITEIGSLLNSNEKAHSVVKNMKSRIQNVKAKTSNVIYRPRVFFQIGISPIVSVGTHTFAHELIELAGGTNLSKGPIPYPRFSKEQVLSLSPEVFIITSMTRNTIFERVKKEWSKWPSLPAVRDKRIHLEDSNLFDRPTPRLVAGLEHLARRIHPELFRPEPFEKEN
ncbi:MAG: cobalamin-binding protein [Deltaproteobacteria bacterium]|nr:cobalamin-binding protein [Deltaproteobacteria bacterium]